MDALAYGPKTSSLNANAPQDPESQVPVPLIAGTSCIKTVKTVSHEYQQLAASEASESGKSSNLHSPDTATALQQTTIPLPKQQREAISKPVTVVPVQCVDSIAKDEDVCMLQGTNSCTSSQFDEENSSNINSSQRIGRANGLSERHSTSPCVSALNGMNGLPIDYRKETTARDAEIIENGRNVEVSEADLPSKPSFGVQLAGCTTDVTASSTFCLPSTARSIIMAAMDKSIMAALNK